jgi:hypothetical protein
MTMTAKKPILIPLIVILSLVASSHSFSVQRRTHEFAAVSRNSSRLLATSADDNNTNEEDKTNKPPAAESSIPVEELLFTTDKNDRNQKTDWDAEWKKVVQNQNQPTQRPGKDFYKTPAEIAAIRATNRAAEEAAKKMAAMPTWESLKGDWKVRLCLCLFVQLSLSHTHTHTQTCRYLAFF